MTSNYAEIPDTSSFLPVGGLGTSANHVYNLPSTQTYLIQVTSLLPQATADSQQFLNTTDNSVTQFGPGFAAFVEDIAPQDQITMTSRSITYMPGFSTTLNMELDTDDLADSYQFSLGSVSASANENVLLQFIPSENH